MILTDRTMKKFVSILMLCAMALGAKAQEGVKLLPRGIGGGKGAKKDVIRGCLYLVVRTLPLDERGSTSDSGSGCIL